MLQALEYHQSDKPSERQATLANNMQTKLSINQLVFRQFMPNVVTQLAAISTKRFVPFVSKFEVLNLADNEHGTALYGENPSDESSAHIDLFQKAAPTLHLDNQVTERASLVSDLAQVRIKGSIPQCKLPLSTLPQNPDTVVMFGLGLGYALKALLAENPPNNVIVYEPHLDMLLASMQVLDWGEIFELAEQSQVRLFLQSGADGSKVKADLKELQRAVGAQTVYFYRHYPCVKLDKAFAQVFGLKGPGNEHAIPMRACLHPIATSDPQLSEALTARFAQNFAANLTKLSGFTPDTLTKIKRVKMLRWQAYVNLHGELNILDVNTGWPLYFDSDAVSLQDQAEKQENYSQKHPAMVELPASRNQGKLWRWHFHRVMKRAATRREESLTSFPEQQADMTALQTPGHVAIGWGLGYGHERWSTAGDYRLSILVEPDAELFCYALASKQTTALLSSRAFTDKRLLCWVEPTLKHIGQLIMQAFRSDYGYVLGAMQWHTLLRRGKDIQLASQLLESVQSIPLRLLSFDDCRFTLNHTLANAKGGCQFLNKTKTIHKRTCVVVGNGPSLGETEFAWIRQNRDDVVVVSCGTALYTLFQANIQPDYHAEGEINRATFDWVNTIQDKEYLSSIDVLGTSALHPDTISLFKGGYLAFKDEDDATNFIAKHIDGFHVFDGVVNAYPTVSNFAVSMLLNMGMQHIVLLGVDFALSDDDKHHSAKSVYSEKQLTDKQAGFDPEKLAKMERTVAGNFRPVVTTKYEFELAQQSMSALLAKFRKVRVENASDGALIRGAEPVKLEQVRVQKDNKPNIASQFSPLLSEAVCTLSDLSWGHLIGWLKRYQETDIEAYLDLSVSDIFDEAESIMRELNQDSADVLFPWIIADTVRLALAYRALLATYVDKSRFPYEVEPNKQALISSVNILKHMVRELGEDLSVEPYRLDNTTLKFLTH